MYNDTFFLSSPLGTDYTYAFQKDPHAMKFKTSLDNGIAAYFSKDETGLGQHYLDLDPKDEELPKISLTWQDFPKTFFRFFLGVDVVNYVGAFYFFLPFMINFVVLTIDIIREKHKRLR